MKKIVFITMFLLLSMSLVSAVTLSFVDVGPLSPGGEGTIRIELENNLDKDVTDVSLALKFADLPFIPIGSSESSIDEIRESKEEEFIFRIKTSSDVTPGDYEIPLQIAYTYDGDRITRTSSIGVQVVANPELSYAISTENSIVGSTGQITLQIINRGFYDARFVSVRILPEDFTLLSEDTIYIGTIDSDDFETANFDVIFKKPDAKFSAIVEFRDFENKKIINQVDLPLNIYTQEKAIELGITKKSNFIFYIVVVVLIIILFVLWRSFKKRQRLRRSQSTK